MRSKNILVEKEKRIRDWRIFCFILVGIVLYLGHALKTTINEIDVFIPPRVSSGVTVKNGSVPVEDVYMLSFSVFQKVGTWLEDGDKEALSNVKKSRYFFTDEFYKEFEKLVSKKVNRGEAKGRTRTVVEASSKGFTPKMVYKVTDSKWVVKMDVRVIERINGTKVKDITVRYPMIVVREKTHPKYNPWGLKFAGFDSTPRKILVKES